MWKSYCLSNSVTGQPRKSWTQLSATAAAGATQITVEHEVDWQVGDRIVIASTGKRHSQKENEEREISAVSIERS